MPSRILAEHGTAVGIDSGPAPAEFVGKVRVFTKTLVVDDNAVKSKFRNLALPYANAVRAAPRSEMLERTAKSWRAMPQADRLELAIDLTKNSLSIAETRVYIGKIVFGHWEPDARENCLIVSGYNLSVSPNRCGTDRT